MICLDIGNSEIKAWDMAGHTIGDAGISPVFRCNTGISGNELQQLLGKNISPGCSICYVSVVPSKKPEIESFCNSANVRCIEYDPSADPRISDTYEGLGHDRIAAAAGVVSVYGDDSFIVVDAGTAIKADVVIERSFQGGVIFPGIDMSLRMLRSGTAQLPEVSFHSEDPPGKDTESCILAGVLYGFYYSVTGFINYYRSLFGDLTCYVTGGYGGLYCNSYSRVPAGIYHDPALIPKSLYHYTQS